MNKECKKWSQKWSLSGVDFFGSRVLLAPQVDTNKRWELFLYWMLNQHSFYHKPENLKYPWYLASGIEVSNRQKTILDREGSAIKSHEINADKWNKNWLVDRDICKYYVLHTYYVGMPRSSWHIILGKPRKTIFWELIGFGSLFGAINKFYFCSRR